MKKEWIAGLGIGAVLAILAVLLFARWWGGHFILHTIDYVVETLTTRSGWSHDLVHGLVILASIPFFWAVAKCTYGLFIPYPSFRLFRSYHGMIIVAYVGIFFLAKYFASRDAYSYEWCDNTQEGIRAFDRPGIDPVYGITLHPCTMEERIALRERDRGFHTPPAVRTSDPHFDTATGRPLQKYYKDRDDHIELFPMDVIHHPRWGGLLAPITPEIAREYEQQQHRSGSTQAREQSLVSSPSNAVAKSGPPGISHASAYVGSRPERPTPLPKPKPHITQAPEPIVVGDFSFAMKQCIHGKNPDFGGFKILHCEGIIENESDRKLQVTFTAGSVVDDNGNQYPLSVSTYYLGLPGILFFGSSNVSQELIPNLPLKFGYEMQRWSTGATAFNFTLKFSTSGHPSESEITFRNIPIRE